MLRVLAKLGAVLGSSSIDYCKNVTRHEQERMKLLKLQHKQMRAIREAFGN